MANVNPSSPKAGDTFYYLGRTRCTVIGETLKPGGVNMEDAIVQVETVSGSPITFLYTASARYLSEKPIPFYKKWPLTAAANR